MPGVADLVIRVHTLAELAGLGRARTALEKFGDALKNVGTSLSVGLTLPLAAVGSAALKMGADYDRAMTKILTLTDTSREQLDAWQAELQRLSHETAIPIQQLAEGLFFIASSSLNAQQKIEALDAAARATALGAGDMEQVARALVATLSAFGDTGLDAERATDILIATVKEGIVELDELTGALGRVLPTASQAGVGFEEIGASMAALSLGGLSAEESATALNQAILHLLANTPEAKKTLEELGLSAAELRKQMAEEGLLSVLRDVAQATGGNIDMLDKLFGNVRALIGVLSLTGQEAQAIDDIFRSVRESGDLLGEGMETLAQSSSFQLKQALNDLRTALVDLGVQLLPIFTDLVTNLEPVAQRVRSLAEGFGRLPESMQQTIFMAAAVVAALGPFLLVTGHILGVLANLAKIVGGLGGLLLRFGGHIASVAVGFVALTGKVGLLRAAFMSLRALLVVSPWMLLVAAVTALAGALALVFTPAEKLPAPFLKAKLVILGVFDAIVRGLKFVADKLAAFVGGILDAVSKLGWFRFAIPGVGQLEAALKALEAASRGLGGAHDWLQNEMSETRLRMIDVANQAGPTGMVVLNASQQAYLAAGNWNALANAIGQAATAQLWAQQRISSAASFGTIMGFRPSFEMPTPSVGAFVGGGGGGGEAAAGRLADQLEQITRSAFEQMLADLAARGFPTAERDIERVWERALGDPAAALARLEEMRRIVEQELLRLQLAIETTTDETAKAMLQGQQQAWQRVSSIVSFQSGVIQEELDKVARYIEAVMRALEQRMLEGVRQGTVGVREVIDLFNFGLTEVAQSVADALAERERLVEEWQQIIEETVERGSIRIADAARLAFIGEMLDSDVVRQWAEDFAAALEGEASRIMEMIGERAAQRFTEAFQEALGSISDMVQNFLSDISGLGGTQTLEDAQTLLQIYGLQLQLLEQQEKALADQAARMEHIAQLEATLANWEERRDAAIADMNRRLEIFRGMTEAMLKVMQQQLEERQEFWEARIKQAEGVLEVRRQQVRAALDAARTQMEAARKALQQQLRQVESELAELRRQREQGQAVRAPQRTLADIARELQEAEQAGHDARVAHLREEYTIQAAIIDSRIAQLEAEKSGIEAAIEAEERRFEELKARMDEEIRRLEENLEQMREQARAELDALRDLIDRWRDARREEEERLRDELEQLRESYDAQIKAIRDQIEVTREQRTEAELLVEQIQRQIDALRAEIDLRRLLTDITIVQTQLATGALPTHQELLDRIRDQLDAFREMQDWVTILTDEVLDATDALAAFALGMQELGEMILRILAGVLPLPIQWPPPWLQLSTATAGGAAAFTVGRPAVMFPEPRPTPTPEAAAIERLAIMLDEWRRSAPASAPRPGVIYVQNAQITSDRETLRAAVGAIL